MFSPWVPALDRTMPCLLNQYATLSQMYVYSRYSNRDFNFFQFVNVHQALLEIVIGKSGLLEGLLLGSVAVVLRSLETVVDVSRDLRRLS
jgi:hypothetical protein